MQDAMAGRAAPPATSVHRYGPGEYRFAELRLPEGRGPFPVAAVIHGGCWLSIADLSYMHAFSEALLDRGWAVWSLEFNRIDQPGGAWPGILEDVAAGLDHLEVVARDHPLELERVVAFGHSSGGHLALWAAGRAGLPPDTDGGAVLRGEAPLRLAGVVGLAPIADLRDYTRYTRCGPAAVQDFLGTEELEGERMALSDPAGLIPRGVPQLLLFGALDPIVPPEHGLAYLERRSSAVDGAGDVRVWTVEGAGHFELVAPFTEGWDDAISELEDWLGELGAGRP
jgi:acetyl esterase/lipase